MSEYMDNQQTTRTQEYAGKIYKCPNCGEELKALDIKCPACGHELQDRAPVASLAEFNKKLQEPISQSHRIELIRNYPIPNAKGDLFEFLLLASSNYDTKKYMESTGHIKATQEAWLAKMEQAYVKAETLFGNDKDFDKFKEIYKSDADELEEVKTKAKNKRYYIHGVLLIIMAIITFLLVMLRGSGLVNNIRLDVTAVVFLINGIMSFAYARNNSLRKPLLICYIADAILNIGFCLMAPGHAVNTVIILLCGLSAFLKKNNDQ